MTKQFHFPLTSAVYSTAVKVRCSKRLWSAIDHPHEYTTAKILGVTCAGFSKADHLAAADYHQNRAERLDSFWGLIADHQMQRIFGRSMGVADYKVCAIGREEFPDSKKLVLRHCAYQSSKHKKMARAHQHIAKFSRLPQ